MSKFSRNSAQKGAISVILAVILPVLVVSLLTIVIDVGQIYRERRELVRVADSIALSIAQQCANGQPCPPSKQSVEESSLAIFNSSDGKVRIDEICGYAPGSTIGSNLFDNSCDSVKVNFNCKDDRVKDANGSAKYKFVRVRVSTLTNSNSTFLNLVFAPLLRDSMSRLKVGACSQAGWSPAVAVPVVYPLALPICQYESSGEKFILGYLENDPVYNNPGKPPFPCSYTPFGSNQLVTNSTSLYLKGAAIYNKIGTSPGEDFKCPSPFTPKLLKLGDVLTVQPSAGQIIRDCEAMLKSIGYFPGNATDYEKFLDDYLFGRKLYIPILGECTLQDPSKCNSFKIVAFATMRIFGINLGSAQTGTGPTGFPGKNNLDVKLNWSKSPNNIDCPENIYCIFGEFERTSPPTRPIPLTSPPPIDAGTQQVFLLP